jgi:hypothetical protein
MKPGKKPRIGWLAFGLAATGLITISVALGLVGWTLYHVKTEPARVPEQQKRLKLASEQAARLIAEGQAQVQQTLNESAPRPSNDKSANDLAQFIRDQMNQHPDAGLKKTLTELNADADKLVELAADCSAWRGNRDAVWDDISQRRTIGNVRNLISKLTGTVQELQGQHRLDNATRYRKWRNATGDDANLLARQILIGEGREQSQDFADVIDQLRDVAMLAEALSAQEQPDGLIDLKDNQIRPVLDRLSESIDVLALDPANHDAVTPQAVHDIGDALFGSGYHIDEGRQSIQIGSGGLYNLRSRALQLRQQRHELLARASEVFREFEQTPTTFDQASRGTGETLALELLTNMAWNWRVMWICGAASLAAFLLLAILMFRAVRTVAGAIEQASAAEMDKVRRQLEEVSSRAALAETAEGVFNSISSVLGGVNASATVIRDAVAHSRVGNLSKASAMIDAHKANLGEFLTVHEKGKQLPAYFTVLARQLSQEHEAVLTELNNLVRGVEQIQQTLPHPQPGPNPAPTEAQAA